MAVAGQEALHQEGQLELGDLEESEELGQAVVATEAPMVWEQVEVQDSPAGSVVVVDVVVVAVPAERKKR